jgi:hypothetical protein
MYGSVHCASQVVRRVPARFCVQHDGGCAAGNSASAHNGNPDHN